MCRPIKFDCSKETVIKIVEEGDGVKNGIKNILNSSLTINEAIFKKNVIRSI